MYLLTQILNTMTKTNKEIKAFLTDLENNSKLDLNDSLQNYFDNEDDSAKIDQDNAFDSIEEELNEQGAFDIEVIYHYKAMKYLTENDQSLQESLELARDMGFELDSLNSETLASLLKSQHVRDDFNELAPQIEEFFNN